MPKYSKKQIRKNRQKWVRALRSKKYKQGMNALRNDRGGFCCLGVACDISRLGQWVEDEEGFIYECKDGSFCSSTLPKGVQDWLGVEGENPSIYIDSEHRLHNEYRGSAALSAFNDDGKRFSTIADLIEEEFLK